MNPTIAEQRREIALQARRCVQWLEANHFEVQHVQRGALKQPIIIIRNGWLNYKLDGMVDAYERTADGAFRYRYVMRFDCQVRWDIVQVQVHEAQPVTGWRSVIPSELIPFWLVDAFRSLQKVGGIHG
jgi:hypothetical protein